jgi:hypothetical protein
MIGKIKITVCGMLYAGFLLGLLFDPKDKGDMFLRKFCWFPLDYMVLYPSYMTIVLTVCGQEIIEKRLRHILKYRMDIKL